MIFSQPKVHAAIAAAVLAAMVFSASAQGNYPNRSIRMVVPFAPGGGTDIVGRLLADSLAPALGTSIVVDNRPGGGSTVGTAIVAKATPDGYTVLLNTIDLSVSPALHKNLSYDPVRDFATVSLVADQPNLMLAHPSLPAKTLKEFTTHVRANAGKLTYGSSGLGTTTHLTTELLMLAIQCNMIHVPYKGIGPAVTAMLGNETRRSFRRSLPHCRT